MSSPFPRALRHKWLNLLRHHKVKLAISSSAGRVTVDGGAESVELRPYPAKKRNKAAKARAAESASPTRDGEDGAFCLPAAFIPVLKLYLKVLVRLFVQR